MCNEKSAEWGNKLYIKTGMVTFVYFDLDKVTGGICD